VHCIEARARSLGVMDLFELLPHGDRVAKKPFAMGGIGLVKGLFDNSSSLHLFIVPFSLVGSIGCWSGFEAMHEVEEKVLSKVGVDFSAPDGIVVICEFRDVVRKLVGHIEKVKKIFVIGRRARYEPGLITCRREKIDGAGLRT
jgi:hypothetical protein